MAGRDAWVALAVVGTFAGAATVYLPNHYWPMTLGIVVVALLAARNLAGLGGALVGTGIGALGLLWVGSQCPPSTRCTPGFDMSGYLVAIAVALVAGGLLTALAVLRPDRSAA